jgi:hypothetical protein
VADGEFVGAIKLLFLGAIKQLFLPYFKFSLLRIVDRFPSLPLPPGRLHLAFSLLASPHSSCRDIHFGVTFIVLSPLPCCHFILLSQRSSCRHLILLSVAHWAGFDILPAFFATQVVVSCCVTSSVLAMVAMVSVWETVTLCNTISCLFMALFCRHAWLL